MHTTLTVETAPNTDQGLLHLASVPFHKLLAEQENHSPTVLDGVLRQITEPGNDLTVSAFGSAI